MSYKTQATTSYFSWSSRRKLGLFPHLTWTWCLNMTFINRINYPFEKGRKKKLEKCHHVLAHLEIHFLAFFFSTSMWNFSCPAKQPNPFSTLDINEIKLPKKNP